MSPGRQTLASFAEESTPKRPSAIDNQRLRLGLGFRFVLWLSCHAFTERPSRQQLLPIPRDNCLLCLPHLEYRCRIGTGNPHRFPLADPVSPSSRLLLVVLYHPRLSFQGKESVEAVAQAHLRDSAGWLCVDSQNHGSNGCHAVIVVRLLRGSEWEHLPTSPSRILHSGPSFRRSRCTPCSETNPASQFQSCSRNGTCCTSPPPLTRGQCPRCFDGPVPSAEFRWVRFWLFSRRA